MQKLSKQPQAVEISCAGRDVQKLSKQPQAVEISGAGRDVQKLSKQPQAVEISGTGRDVQKLSKRLQAAADFVTQGSRAADIGTDHGYLPIYLVQSGRCPKALAMDVREGPLERAGAHIAACRLEAYIETRLSDGLSNLGRDEADSVIIAGMGGMSVIKILEAAADMLPDIKELILEPQSDIAKVRKLLREHNIYIDRENLVHEEGKYYPVLHAVWEKPECAEDSGCTRMWEALWEKLKEPERLQRVFDQYGACLVYGRHPVLQKMLERDERVKREILRSIQSSPRQEKNALRRMELEDRLEEIRVLREVIEL